MGSEAIRLARVQQLLKACNKTKTRSFECKECGQLDCSVLPDAKHWWARSVRCNVCVNSKWLICHSCKLCNERFDKGYRILKHDAMHERESGTSSNKRLKLGENNSYKQIAFVEFKNQFSTKSKTEPIDFGSIFKDQNNSDFFQHNVKGNGASFLLSMSQHGCYEEGSKYDEAELKLHTSIAALVDGITRTQVALLADVIDGTVSITKRRLERGQHLDSKRGETATSLKSLKEQAAPAPLELEVPRTFQDLRKYLLIVVIRVELGKL
jgi:hypothetical protein